MILTSVHACIHSCIDLRVSICVCQNTLAWRAGSMPHPVSSLIDGNISAYLFVISGVQNGDAARKVGNVAKQA